MDYLDKFCNNHMIGFLQISLFLNVDMLVTMLGVPAVIWIIGLFLFFIVLFYEIIYSIDMDYLLHYGKKIMITSPVYYRKIFIPNRVNAYNSSVCYVITIEDTELKRKYKTKATIASKKHCQEFEELLRNRPMIEILVDNYDDPHSYYIVLDELVKYTTDIKIQETYRKKGSRAGFMILLILNLIGIFLQCLQYWHYS